MKLKFTIHFQERIVERGINLDHVKLAIKNPDSKKVAFENSTIVTKRIRSKIIEVVYFKDQFRDRKDEYIIVTAYYL